jgi:hypothetical protein
MLSVYEMKLIVQFGRDGWSPQEIAQTILDIRNKTISESFTREILSYMEGLV